MDSRILAATVVLALLAALGCDDQPSAIDEEATPPAASPTTPAEREDGTEPTPGESPPPAGTPTPDPVPEEAESPGPVGAFGVSAGHSDAVEVGMQVLAGGGNAVDAAIATAFAVSVVEPFASGIGGGGAAIVVEWEGEPQAYDYREVVADDGRIPASNTGIPGFVAGMETLHERHGTGDLAELVAPSVTLAREGVPAAQIVADQLRSAAHRLSTGDLPHLYPGGSAIAAGDPLVQEDLATTLEHLVEHGARSFYEGEFAHALAERVDGVDPASLAAYEVHVAPPASGAFAGFEVLGPAPPLPGATVVQILQVAEALGLAGYAPGSADFVHALLTGWRLGDHVLRWEMGDPASVDVPLAAMTDPDANAALAGHASMDAVLDLDTGRRDGGLEGNTTHVTVVDADGMVVSMTNTLTNFWGSGDHELGFFLNDQLRRFDIGAGGANQPAPRMRSVSWAAPVVVLDDQRRPVLGIGTPGGRRIPVVLAQVVARWGLHGEPLDEAVEAPRFHAEGTEVEAEALPVEVAESLAARGYHGFVRPELRYYWGSVQALEIDYDAGEVRGAHDPRRAGDWRVERP